MFRATRVISTIGTKFHRNRTASFCVMVQHTDRQTFFNHIYGSLSYLSSTNTRNYYFFEN